MVLLASIIGGGYTYNNKCAASNNKCAASKRQVVSSPCVSVVSEKGQLYGINSRFTSSPIPDAVFRRMVGRSYKSGYGITRNDLRYLHVLHYDAVGEVHEGEIVCHRDVADDLLSIFRALYDARYPIEKIRLVDDYAGDDERSMAANNTSCFNARRVAGRRQLSRHSLGRAVDINPLYNPHVKSNGQVSPASAKAYADRHGSFPYKITRDDLCCRLFRQHGFRWGGDWKHSKDYQHFEK